MKHGKGEVSRRVFARGLAMLSVGLAPGGALGALANPSQAAGQAAAIPQKAHKSDGEYNRHPPLVEPEPFAEPLAFARRDLRLKARPFALDQVVLEDGPLKEARELNRSYMLRLGSDRAAGKDQIVTLKPLSRSWERFAVYWSVVS